MQTDQLLLIDLSGIAHQLFHVSGNEPDPNFISTNVIGKCRALASNHPHAAICCDNGKSFRAELDPTYKAQRDTENRGVLKHQMTLACETLKADGFPIWSVRGFEADDLIATATVRALDIEGASVLIASTDKDLLQMVGERVQMKKTTDGIIMDTAAVLDKFKVSPSQMRDYLCLVGDASDNVKGAKGIGGVTASKLLSEHGTLQNIYSKMDAGVVPGITPAMRTNLMEFRERWPLVQQLIELRTDAPIPFDEIAAERTPPQMEDDVPKTLSEMSPEEFEQFEDDKAPTTAPYVRPPLTEADFAGPASAPKTPVEFYKEAMASEPAVHPIIKRVANAVVETLPVPADFSQQLEPRNIEEAKVLAKHAFASRLFNNYGTPEAVFMVLLSGRELGMTAMASLRGFHLVEGKPTLSADLIRALIIRSGKAKYFRPTERTATRATWETQRGDDPPVSLTFTIEEAQQAGVVRNGSGWMKFPADMLTARASSKLARLVYSDVVFNLYAPEDLE